MAKKSFVNPFIILSAPGEDIIITDVTGMGTPDAISYDSWLSMADVEYDDWNGNGQIETDDYLLWWYACAEDPEMTGFTPDYFKQINGYDLPPRPEV